MTAKDKHGREMRAGDLVWYWGMRVRLLTGFSSANYGEMKRADVLLRNAKEEWFYEEHRGVYGPDNWEILARGTPSDPLPEHFEPVRDREGRPVLCDFVHVFLNGVCRCGLTERQHEYDEAMAKRDTRPCPAPDATFRRSGACDLCGNSANRLTPAVLHGECASACQECAAMDGDPWVASVAFGLAALHRPIVIDHAERDERIRSRYVAFDRRVREIVEEEAPRARVVTDIGFARKAGVPAFIASYDYGEGWRDYWAGVDAPLSDVETDLRARFRAVREEMGKRELGKR